MAFDAFESRPLLKPLWLGLSPGPLCSFSFSFSSAALLPRLLLLLLLGLVWLAYHTNPGEKSFRRFLSRAASSSPPFSPLTAPCPPLRTSPDRIRPSAPLSKFSLHLRTPPYHRHNLYVCSFISVRHRSLHSPLGSLDQALAHKPHWYLGLLGTWWPIDRQWLISWLLASWPLHPCLATRHRWLMPGILLSMPTMTARLAHALDSSSSASSSTSTSSSSKSKRKKRASNHIKSPPSSPLSLPHPNPARARSPARFRAHLRPRPTLDVSCLPGQVPLGPCPKPRPRRVRKHSVSGEPQGSPISPGASPLVSNPPQPLHPSGSPPVGPQPVPSALPCPKSSALDQMVNCPSTPPPLPSSTHHDHSNPWPPVTCTQELVAQKRSHSSQNSGTISHSCPRTSLLEDQLRDIKAKKVEQEANRANLSGHLKDLGEIKGLQEFKRLNLNEKLEQFKLTHLELVKKSAMFQKDLEALRAKRSSIITNFPNHVEKMKKEEDRFKAELRKSELDLEQTSKAYEAKRAQHASLEEKLSAKKAEAARKRESNRRKRKSKVKVDDSQCPSAREVSLRASGLQDGQCDHTPEPTTAYALPPKSCSPTPSETGWASSGVPLLSAQRDHRSAPLADSVHAAAAGLHTFPPSADPLLDTELAQPGENPWAADPQISLASADMIRSAFITLPNLETNALADLASASVVASPSDDLLTSLAQGMALSSSSEVDQMMFPCLGIHNSLCPRVTSAMMESEACCPPYFVSPYGAIGPQSVGVRSLPHSPSAFKTGLPHPLHSSPRSHLVDQPQQPIPHPSPAFRPPRFGLGEGLMYCSDSSMSCTSSPTFLSPHLSSLVPSKETTASVSLAPQRNPTNLALFGGPDDEGAQEVFWRSHSPMLTRLGLRRTESSVNLTGPGYGDIGMRYVSGQSQDSALNPSRALGLVEGRSMERAGVPFAKRHQTSQSFGGRTDGSCELSIFDTHPSSASFSSGSESESRIFQYSVTASPSKLNPSAKAFRSCGVRPLTASVVDHTKFGSRCFGERDTGFFSRSKPHHQVVCPSTAPGSCVQSANSEKCRQVHCGSPGLKCGDLIEHSKSTMEPETTKGEVKRRSVVSGLDTLKEVRHAEEEACGGPRLEGAVNPEDAGEEDEGKEEENEEEEEQEQEEQEEEEERENGGVGKEESGGKEVEAVTVLPSSEAQLGRETRLLLSTLFSPGEALPLACTKTACAGMFGPIGSGAGVSGASPPGLTRQMVMNEGELGMAESSKDLWAPRGSRVVEGLLLGTAGMSS